MTAINNDYNTQTYNDPSIAGANGADSEVGFVQQQMDANAVKIQLRRSIDSKKSDLLDMMKTRSQDVKDYEEALKSGDTQRASELHDVITQETLEIKKVKKEITDLTAALNKLDKESFFHELLRKEDEQQNRQKKIDDVMQPVTQALTQDQGGDDGKDEVIVKTGPQPSSGGA